MKFPILYEQNETDFFILGLGPLTNSIKATVTEERNGAFYFEGEVLTNSEQFKLLKNDMIIKADAGHTLKNQRFRIKRIVDKHDGVAEIYAEHISYLAQELSLKPEVSIKSADGNGVITRWKNSIIDKNPFVVDSDVTTTASTKWEIGEVDNAREALGGVKGSILDNWGGEYRFDNYHISLLQKRGKPANTLLAYGRNITDFEQERNITNTYTSVFPFARYTDDKQSEHLVTIDNYIVDSKYVDNYPNRKALPVDFSDKFEHEEKPTKEKLVKLAETYIKLNEIGIPKTSIRVSFLDLSKASMYDVFQPLEQLSLCDDVRVEYPLLGVSTVSKVIKTVWNVLTDSYDEIEIGEKRTTLSTTIKEQQEAIKEVEKNVNGALVAANGKNMVFYGLYGENGLGEPVATMIGDMWYKPVGEDTELYIWNGTIWEFIMSTAPDDTIKEKIEELEQTSKDISESVDKALEEAEIARQEAFNSEKIASEAKKDAQEAKTEIKTHEQQITLQSVEIKQHATEIANIKVDNNQISQTVANFEQGLSDLDKSNRNLVVNSDFEQETKQYTNSTSLDVKVQNVAEAFRKPITPAGKELRVEKKSNAQGFLNQDLSYKFANKVDSIAFSFYYATSLNFKGYFRAYIRIVEVGGNVVYLNSMQQAEATKGELVRYINVADTSNLNIESARLVINFSETEADSVVWFQALVVNEGNSASDWSLSADDAITRTEFSNVTQTIKGLQVTVKDKANQSEVTIMSDQLNSTIKKVDGAESQITQLSNQMDFKVSVDEVVSRINMSPERVRIDSKLIHLSGQTLIDDAVIKNAMIANGAIDNAKIKNATISDAKIISIAANKVVARDLSAITTNTGTLNISGWMNILTDNMGIRGSFDYGDDADVAYPRWYNGEFRLSHRHLFFNARANLVYANGSKGPYHGYGESFYGANYFKSRWYDNTAAKTLKGRIDIRDDFIQVSKSWSEDKMAGTLIKSDVVYSNEFNVLDITARDTGSNIYFNRNRRNLADFRIGLDGGGKVVQSEAIYGRTYNSQPAVCVTDAGNLGRVVSAKKYKDKIEVADDVISKAKTILSIEPKSWEAKNSDSGIRHYGFIADDFHDSDLKEVVLYSHDEVEGLSYDRITMYHNVVLSEHEKEINKLHKKINKLEELLNIAG